MRAKYAKYETGRSGVVIGSFNGWAQMRTPNRAVYIKQLLSDGKPWSAASLRARIIKVIPPEELAELYRREIQKDCKRTGREVHGFGIISVREQVEIGAGRFVAWVMWDLWRHRQVTRISISPAIYQATPKLLRAINILEKKTA